jgi:DNA ligase-associated metallophosphoesterase
MNAPLASTKCRTTASCTLAGMNVVLDMSGALYLPEGRVLVVADMHLEKATSGARRGIFLPPYDSRITLDLLSRTVAAYLPDRVVFLGDSFHDAHAPLRLDAICLDTLAALSQSTELIWVTGNHDPDIPKSIAAEFIAEFFLNGLHFTHIPELVASNPQVSGHLHPVVTVTGRGRTLRRRCFATDGSRMILPAFGAYTGGLNVKDKAFDGLFKRSTLTTHVIGEQGIYSLPITTNRI